MISYAIYTILTLIFIHSHICSFILRFSYFSIIHIFLYFIIHAFTHSYIHICLSFMYMYSFLVTSYILLTYIFMYFIILSYLMTYTNTFRSLYVLLVLYQTVLSPVGVTELIPILRYLYTYLYFYLSYPCIYLILCMIYYDYHIRLLFFLVSGPNMSSTFIILCMAVFLTQWSFHRV